MSVTVSIVLYSRNPVCFVFWGWRWHYDTHTSGKRHTEWWLVKRNLEKVAVGGGSVWKLAWTHNELLMKVSWFKIRNPNNAGCQSVYHGISFSIGESCHSAGHVFLFPSASLHSVCVCGYMCVYCSTVGVANLSWLPTALHTYTQSAHHSQLKYSALPPPHCQIVQPVVETLLADSSCSLFVKQLSSEIARNGVLYDKSMKFGTLIANRVLKINGYGAILNFQYGGHESHYSKWPPATNSVIGIILYWIHN